MVEHKKYNFKDIDLAQLNLNPYYPRLPNYVQGKDEDEIISHMLLEESTLELMQAIGKNGFFPGEQLLVVERDNKYTVIEGNRRLTSVKLLNNPKLAKVQNSLVDKVWEEANFKGNDIITLPCMVFEKENDIHDYLGYKHITGIQPWNLRQKAKYLTFLKERNFPEHSIFKASFELRKMIGSKQDYVNRILVGYQVYVKIKEKKFFKIKDLSDEGFYFSYIADSLRHANISRYLGINLNANSPLEDLELKKLENWATWLYKPIEINGRVTTRLKGKSDHLNKLNAVLGYEKAKEQFIEHDASLEEAFTYTKDYQLIFKNSIENSIYQLSRANSITGSLDTFYENLEEDLKSVIRLARLINSAKQELTKNEFEGDEF